MRSISKKTESMGVTRLKRKGKKNKAKSATRNFSLKHLTKVPVIKNVDIEELKKEFGAAGKKQTKKAEAAAPAPAPKAVEAEAPVETPVAEEVKEKPAKKAAAKKEAAAEEKAEKAPKAKAAKKDKEESAE